MSRDSQFVSSAWLLSACHPALIAGVCGVVQVFVPAASHAQKALSPSCSTGCVWVEWEVGGRLMLARPWSQPYILSTCVATQLA